MLPPRDAAGLWASRMKGTVNNNKGKKNLTEKGALEKIVALEKIMVSYYRHKEAFL
jgi:hypothetical protein